MGLITARGGSKGLPRKNVLPLGGKPLLLWTIDAAQRSNYLARVIVSTDDPEIAGIARGAGADVPFLRPAELAQDDSPHILTVLHAAEWVERVAGQHYEYVMLLQPTSPFRNATDIDNAVGIAQQKQAPAVVSVCETHHHPCLTRKVTDQGTLARFVEEDLAYPRRQDLPPAYFINGAIYLVRRDILDAERTMIPDGTYPYVMPDSRSFQIDSPWDLQVAEALLTAGLIVAEATRSRSEAS